jgi:hypothetical protein
MGLSVNTGVCEDLRKGEHEAKCECWYLQGSERSCAEEASMRLSTDTGVCDDMRSGYKGTEIFARI